MFLLVSCQQNMLKVTQGTHENDIPGFRSIFVKFRFRNTFPSKKHVFLSQTNVFNQRNQYNSKSVDRALKFIGLPTTRFTGKKHDHLKRPVVVAFFLWPTVLLVFWIGVRLSIPVHFFLFRKHRTVWTSRGEKACEVVENSFFDVVYDNTTRLRLVSEIIFKFSLSSPSAHHVLTRNR